MRPFIAVLLLACSSGAQTKPDFSGIFLRTETKIGKEHARPAIPRILDIKQTASEVTVTATQGGETAVAHYRFDSKKTDKVQTRLKGKAFVLRTKLESRGALWEPFELPNLSRNLEERWELSADAQQFTIRDKADRSLSELDTYTREPSIEAAEAAANGATRTDCTGALPISELFRETLPIRKFDHGAELGITWLRRLTRCVVYDAVLSGDFFKDLHRIEKSGFYKNGKPVSDYPGNLVLDVAPRPNVCSGEIGGWEQTRTPPADAVLNLRFKVRWMGEQEKDLGEVPSEFSYEPWREFRTPAVFYRMSIPAKDVPLADDLEVLILSKTGEQLACIKGHI